MTSPPRNLGTSRAATSCSVRRGDPRVPPRRRRRSAGVAAADSLCEACVVLFDTDAAAISLIFEGASSGTLGSSSASARTYDELQFTLGEGPCLDSVKRRAPIVVVDLADSNEARWPAFGPALLAHEIRGVAAITCLPSSPALRRAAGHRVRRISARRPPRAPPAAGCNLRTGPRIGTVSATGRRGPLRRLLRHRPNRLGRRPSSRRRAVATVRPRRPRG